MSLTTAESLIKEYFKITSDIDEKFLDKHASLLLKYNKVGLRYKAAASFWLQNS